MKFYRWAELKAWFDKGYSLTSYIKVVLAVMGLTTRSISLVLWIALGYGIFCFILGWWAYKYGWVIAETEVSNNHNNFVKEMRKRNL